MVDGDRPDLKRSPHPQGYEAGLWANPSLLKKILWKLKKLKITETAKRPHNPHPLPGGVTRVMMMSGPPSK